MTTGTGHAVEVSAVVHEITIVAASTHTGSQVHREIRHDGLVRLIGDDGSELAAERCQHYQGAIGGARTHPHRDAAEAMRCARVVAGLRYPGAEIREAR